jgi:DNA-binding transcriptional MocR family regulator
VLNAFLDCTAGRLSRAEVLAWLILYRDTRNGTARTSHGDIARRAGIGRRNVVRAIGRLERRGLLGVVYRGGLNRGPSAYRVYPLEPPVTGDNSMPGASDAGVASAGVISMRSLVTRASHIP